VGLTAAAHSQSNMLSLADYNWWTIQFPGTEKSPIQVAMAANWMMRTCERKGVWDPSDTRGRGAWFDDGRIVVHCGDMLYVDRTPMAPSQIRSQYVYELASPCARPSTTRCRSTTPSCTSNTCAGCRSARDLEAVLMAGWTVCAHIGGVR